MSRPSVPCATDPPSPRVLCQHRLSAACTDTGRLVGTGTSSAAAARLAIVRAQHQLAEQAGVCVHVRNFQARFLGLLYTPVTVS